MTTPEPTPAEAQTPGVAPETPAEPPTPDPGADTPISLSEARKLRSENAALRARAKEAEEAYGGAAATVSAMQHTEVERHAAEVLVDPADIWRADGATLDTFIDDEFHSIVGDRVVETAKQLAASKPHLAKQQPPAAPPSRTPIESLRSGGGPPPEQAGTSWSEAIRGH